VLERINHVFFSARSAGENALDAGGFFCREAPTKIQTEKIQAPNVSLLHFAGAAQLAAK